MSKPPSFRRVSSTDASGVDLENPSDAPSFLLGAYIELTERMPHLKNPKLISHMRLAVGEVVQARSTLRTLGPRPDHESVDKARLRLSDIDSYASESQEIQEEYEIYKTMITLEEMHDAYEGVLSNVERRLEKIYEATLAGDDGGDLGEEEVDEEVVATLKDVEEGKVFERIELP